MSDERQNRSGYLGAATILALVWYGREAQRGDVVTARGHGQRSLREGDYINVFPRRLYHFFTISQRQPPPTSKDGDAGGAGWRDKRVSTQECSSRALPKKEQHPWLTDQAVLPKQKSAFTQYHRQSLLTHYQRTKAYVI